MELSPLEEFVVSFCCNVTVKRSIPSSGTLEGIRGYFDSIGKCEKTKLTPENVAELSDWSLVWYTVNSKGETGCDKEESNNYTVADFVNHYSLGKLNLPAYSDRINQLECIIEKLRCGLNQPITITVAYDNELNKNLVIDGVKRTIALYYLKLTDSKLLEKIISEYPVYILKFSSNICHKVFPCDFQKLTF